MQLAVADRDLLLKAIRDLGDERTRKMIDWSRATHGRAAAGLFVTRGSAAMFERAKPTILTALVGVRSAA